MPASLWKSYPVYSGAVDAMAQWWYGHNAVAFLLTVGYLAMMYYYVPKQAQRPIYSYRLSIVHFWALISIYMWAGPHHLHYTALPDWAQSLGMVFSVILLVPSWGGAMNGILTLSGVWYKLRTDPILKFLIVAISFYMIATFEGPLLSIKTVNSLSHYTDWTIGRPRRHPGLGGDDLDRFDLLDVSAPARPVEDAFDQTDRRALLAAHAGRGVLHRLDVDHRHHPGPDVARHQLRRHADLQLRRVAGGHLPLLPGPFLRRRRSEGRRVGKECVSSV